ncbi:hypothetical protein QR680_007235 [Steinernema hermaphroditum]|uniref:Uncharacterized protein n=1 Tax=Steinernema hermaphroditum TaxID=289476 RepID=A0AA39HY55_9BILA|nr:hypothetical protein QR680_007235 [Steinernema hermaphroditum]
MVALPTLYIRLIVSVLWKMRGTSATALSKRQIRITIQAFLVSLINLFGATVSVVLIEKPSLALLVAPSINFLWSMISEWYATREKAPRFANSKILKAPKFHSKSLRPGRKRGEEMFGSSS